MQIDDITTGDPKKNYLVRYRGQIYGDTDQAYARLAELLKPHQITPLFRNEDEQHAVLFIPGRG